MAAPSSFLTHAFGLGQPNPKFRIPNPESRIGGALPGHSEPNIQNLHWQLNKTSETKSSMTTDYDQTTQQYKTIMEEILQKRRTLDEKECAIAPTLKEIKCLKKELTQDLEDLALELGNGVTHTYKGYTFGSVTKERVNWGQAKVRVFFDNVEDYVKENTETVHKPLLRKDKARKRKRAMEAPQ